MWSVRSTFRATKGVPPSPAEAAAKPEPTQLREPADKPVKGKRAKREAGAAVIEFALVVPLLLMLVFGIIDFGMLINTKDVIGNAAREGARNGSISHSEAVIDASVTSALGSIPAKDVTITVGCKGPAPTYTVCPKGGFDANVKSGGTVQVTVTYHYNWITPIPSLIGMGDSTGMDIVKTVEMRVE